MPLTVELRGLSGSLTVPVEGDNPTVADVRQAAGLGDSLSIRSGGSSVSDDSPVQDGDSFVTTPPEAKHG